MRGYVPVSYTHLNTQLKAMMDEGIAMPYEEIFSRKLDTYSHPAFLAEEIAMMPFSAWMLRYVNDEENFPHDFVTTFAPFPSTDDGTPDVYKRQGMERTAKAFGAENA